MSGLCSSICLVPWIFWDDLWGQFPDFALAQGLCSDLGPIDFPVLCSNSYLDPQAATKSDVGREGCKGLQGAHFME